MVTVSKFSVIFYLVTINGFNSRSLLESYNDYRANLIQEEEDKSLGGDLMFDNEEKEANDVLMYWKYKEINESWADPDYFAFSKPLHNYKQRIEESTVYKILSMMPKGALLHIHNSFTSDADFLMTLTYEDNLYLCDSGKEFKFKFSETIPKNYCLAEWKLVKDLREKSERKNEFDQMLREHLLLYNENDQFVPDINTIWKKFNNVTDVVKSLITYRAAREMHLRDTLKRLYEDNIMYAEIRTGLTSVYELNGTCYDKRNTIRLYREIIKDFVDDHPDFIGVKLILTSKRSSSEENIDNFLNLVEDIKNEMPEIVAGYDIVGQEDLGKPLKHFAPILIEHKKSNLDYIFHAGETNSNGGSADENLYDVILLGTKRIGHAFTLVKHPVLMERVKREGIAIESNVISNIMLSLVSDARNHPLATYIANNLPIVLSSDCPGTWGSTALSHDFYVVFMGVAHIRSDFRMLKQLALNSIKFSTLEINDQEKAYDIFEYKWKMFISDVINKFKIY